MENTDNVKALYGALKKRGFKDIGSEEVFRNKMQYEGNRKTLYQALSGKGFRDIGDYETFNSRVSASYIKDDAKPVVGQIEGEEVPEQKIGIDSVEKVDTAESKHGVSPVTEVNGPDENVDWERNIRNRERVFRLIRYIKMFIKS